MTTETTFTYSAGTRYSDNGLHERLSSAIECLRPLAVRSSPQSSPQFTNCSDVWPRGGFTWRFSGQFKRGKSTLLNALLGEAILPAARSEKFAGNS